MTIVIDALRLWLAVSALSLGQENIGRIQRGPAAIAYALTILLEYAPEKSQARLGQ